MFKLHVLPSVKEVLGPHCSPEKPVFSNKGSIACTMLFFYTNPFVKRKINDEYYISFENVMVLHMYKVNLNL